TVRDRRRQKRIRAKLAEVGNREPEFADYMKNRRDWLYQHLPEASAEFIYDLHSKRKQKAMAQRVGIPVATEYVSASPLTAVLDELATGSFAEAVLKPIHGRGGAGVFCLVREGDAFRELKSGKMHDIKRLKRIAEDSYQYMRRADEWILEELLLYPGDPTEPARDVKFYCFGGRTELVLQKGMVLDGRGRRVVKRRFFDRDGSPVDP